MEARTDWPKYRVKLMAIAHGLAKPVLGILRYVITLALFCVVWWYDARYLNRWFDANLAVIKGASSLVDNSGKVEAMLRAFAAEKMLLFGEGSGLVWLVGKGLKCLFGKFIARRSPEELEPKRGRPLASPSVKQP